MKYHRDGVTKKQLVEIIANHERRLREWYKKAADWQKKAIEAVADKDSKSIVLCIGGAFQCRLYMADVKRSIRRANYDLQAGW